MTIRDQVLSAFRPDKAYSYSCRIPFAYDGFIDGMAWVGMLCGAAHLADDDDVIEVTERYLSNLIIVGKDARTFGPTSMVSNQWALSETMLDYSYKAKPQSFAGPAALHWAIAQGATIDFSGEVPGVSATANLMCMVAPLYAPLVKYVSGLRQHLNSFMFAHLLLDQTPPDSMLMFAEGNPVYQYIFGLPVSDMIYVPTGPWPAKDWPGGEKIAKNYVPLCSLVGQLLRQAQ